MLRDLRTRILTVVALGVALAQPAHAHAGTYRWDGTPAAGSNGFAWEQTGGFNPWAGGSRCETAPATIPTSGHCTLRWNVPAGLDAQSGHISGNYRQNNANFEQRNHVDGSGTTTLQGDSTTRSYRREWPDMGSWLSIQLVNVGAPQTVSAGTQWFDALSFGISLVDPHAPTLSHLGGAAGWHGATGACLRSGWSDVGSGIATTSIVDTTTGHAHEHAAHGGGGVTTGVFATDRTTCVPAPGTGTRTYRVTAVDRSGNRVDHQATISFDVTPPSLGAITVNGAAIPDRWVVRGSEQPGYASSFAVDASDAHSGLATVQVYLDGARVASGVRWTSGALAHGTHVVRFRAIDAMGNEANVMRTIVVEDDVAPRLAIDAPAAAGGNDPVLDVRATDDHTGIDTTAWSVTVDGAPLVATSDTARLQAAIGALVDGRHELEVRVRDGAGNLAVARVDYEADSGDDIPNPTCMTCVFAWRVPDAGTDVHDGEELRIGAVLARNGRPVAGTVEIRRGDATLAEQGISPNGAVDIAVRITDPGPLLIVPPAGSGLAPLEFTYRFVADTTPPELVIASPSATGGSEPVLDVSASDAQGSVDPSTWTVHVNGEALVASSSTARLQANIGFLVDGAHVIRVSVADARGNVATREFEYRSNGGDALPDPAGTSGIFVYAAPSATTRVVHGTAVTVGAIVVRHGRPVTGRAELRRGVEVLASAQIGPAGSVELRAAILGSGPLTLSAPASAGLEPATIDYAYEAASAAAETPTPARAPAPEPSAAAVAPSPAIPATCTVRDHRSCPRDVVYYVAGIAYWNGIPLAESGAKLDRVAPTFRLTPIRERAGSVRRARRLALRLWTNEMAVLRLQPTGAAMRTTVNPRRTWRTIHVRIGAATRLGRRLARTRAGGTIVVRMRVVAIDKNENRSTPRWMTFRFRA